MRKLALAAVAGALCVALAGCTPGPTNPTPKPSFTQVPTTSPSPTPGVDTPLASTVNRGIGSPVYIEVYDVKAWSSKAGCECSAPGQSGELYAAGSAVWAIRVELISDPKWAHDDGFDAGALTMTASWGAGAPIPVEAKEGEALAETENLGWGFDSVKSPSSWAWGDQRSYLATIYVPRGAVSLRLDIVVPPSGSKGNTEPISVGLDIPVPEAVSELTYTGSGE